MKGVYLKNSYLVHNRLSTVTLKSVSTSCSVTIKMILKKIVFLIFDQQKYFHSHRQQAERSVRESGILRKLNSRKCHSPRLKR